MGPGWLLFVLCDRDFKHPAIWASDAFALHRDIGAKNVFDIFRSIVHRITYKITTKFVEFR